MTTRRAGGTDGWKEDAATNTEAPVQAGAMLAHPRLPGTVPTLLLSAGNRRKAGELSDVERAAVGVADALSHLDGSASGAVALCTGMSVSELKTLGGIDEPHKRISPDAPATATSRVALTGRA